MVAVVLILVLSLISPQSSVSRGTWWPRPRSTNCPVPDSDKLCHLQARKEIIKQAFLGLPCCLRSAPCQALISGWIRADQGLCQADDARFQPYVNITNFTQTPQTTNRVVRSQRIRRSHAQYRQRNFPFEVDVNKLPRMLLYIPQTLNSLSPFLFLPLRMHLIFNNTKGYISSQKG